MKSMRLALVALAVAFLPYEAFAVPSLTFMARPYHLASYNQTARPMWEFVPAGDTISYWTSLVTLINCPDAHTNADVDRVSGGILANYQKHQAHMLITELPRDPRGMPYDYIVAGFDEPLTRRYELDFVKVAMTGSNASILIYGVRFRGGRDYQSKASVYLTQHSEAVRQDLETAVVPSVKSLPRRVF